MPVRYQVAGLSVDSASTFRYPAYGLRLRQRNEAQPCNRRWSNVSGLTTFGKLSGVQKGRHWLATENAGAASANGVDAPRMPGTGENSQTMRLTCR
jgi:hypothetical protein